MSNYRRVIVNNEWEGVWKEAVVVKFMVITFRFHGRTEENIGKLQYG